MAGTRQERQRAAAIAVLHAREIGKSIPIQVAGDACRQPYPVRACRRGPCETALAVPDEREELCAHSGRIRGEVDDIRVPVGVDVRDHVAAIR